MSDIYGALKKKIGFKTKQRVEACDDNPLGVSVLIRSSYLEALDLMEACLIRL